MPDARKPAEVAPEAKSAAASPPAAPAPPSGTAAGESSDPDVQFLIANRRAHELVLEMPDATDENRDHARQSIEGIDLQLREKGYR